MVGLHVVIWEAVGRGMVGLHVVIWEAVGRGMVGLHVVIWEAVGRGMVRLHVVIREAVGRVIIRGMVELVIREVVGLELIVIREAVGPELVVSRGVAGLVVSRVGQKRGAICEMVLLGCSKEVIKVEWVLRGSVQWWGPVASLARAWGFIWKISVRIHGVN
jgi:hypothetical protein